VERDSDLERLRFHSLLLFLEGLIAIVFIFVDESRETSRLPITTVFPLVLYSYGMHGALSTAVILFVKRFKTRWYWVLSLHALSLALMFALSILVFSLLTPVFLPQRH
jgi:hypothetical protein